MAAVWPTFGWRSRVDGSRARAVQSFEQALALDPGTPGAAGQLELLEEGESPRLRASPATPSRRLNRPGRTLRALRPHRAASPGGRAAHATGSLTMLSMPRAFLLFVLLAVPALSAHAADKVTTIPVHFTKGSHSATVKGSFAGYDAVHYTLAARTGQSMTVKISGSSNANFNVFAPGDQPGQSTAIGRGYVGGDWTGILPANGTYTVQVFQMRASARRGEKVAFTLQLAIDGAANMVTDATAARPTRTPPAPCPAPATRASRPRRAPSSSPAAPAATPR